MDDDESVNEETDDLPEEKDAGSGQADPTSPWKNKTTDPGRDDAPSPWGKDAADPGRDDAPSPWGKDAAGPGRDDAPSPWGKDAAESDRENFKDPRRDPEREDEAPLWQGEPPSLPEEEVLVPVEEESPDEVTAGWSRRRRNRSVAIQFLYSWELNRPDDLSDALVEFFVDRDLDRDKFVFAEELIHGATGKMEEIDQVISEVAENWKFDRIAKIDLTLLRLGIHEMLHRPDVPPVVVINEIIDLGKAYSERKSKRFLNGVLDRVLEKLDRPHRESSL
jgi:N utilization substance protein B